MVVLVDTSVWIDHLRTGDPGLTRLLGRAEVLAHDWVILGTLRDRAGVLGLLSQLPRAPVASAAEVLTLIDRHGLAGAGIGYVDAQLLASGKLAGARVWSRDRRLAAAAARLELSHPSLDPST
ncbi:type II toxin-antitoxin system VapC family toxin [Modestobacter sp. DSM 44400]|uniref:type II toxin-antitoxin system VapC family toxin n=1 Tax=Modestobacter sp. DSM 44400 TaxID=1550230 RepID=UPI000B8685D8|nr:hypothetical protein [Modestobacter sp. DSM 44400]